MAAFVLTAKTILMGTVWSAPATAPGLGAGVTIAGTITSSSNTAAFVTGGDPGFHTDMLETTNFASGGYRQFIPGLSAGDDLQIPFNADFAASNGWSMIQTVIGAAGVSRPGDVVRYVDINPTGAARSATNPSLVIAVYGKGIQPISGAVGVLATHAVTLQLTGGFAYLIA